MNQRPVLEVRDLYKYFPVTQSHLSARRIHSCKAVDEVSFTLGRGEVLAAGGRIGVRQDHHRAHLDRPRGADRRRDSVSRRDGGRP